MFYLNSPEELTTEKLVEFIQLFNTSVIPQYNKMYDYYIGKHEILMKKPISEDRPCNKIIDNHCNTIVNNYLGYITGKPITYTNNNTDFEEITDILKYNDVKTVDNQLLKNALIYGVAYELQYIDNNKKLRFKSISPKEMFLIKSADIEENILYAVRIYTTDIKKQNYIIDVYNKTEHIIYTCDSGFANLIPINNISHLYKDVPVSEFILNDDNQNIFEQIISMQDCYNKLFSGEVDDFENFVDCYMLITGVQLTDEQLKTIKDTHILNLYNNNEYTGEANKQEFKAEYLTKQIADTQIENMLNRIKKDIFSKTNCPDFTDENFSGNASGVAIKYKILGFENVSGNIENNMRKCLQRRIELFNNILITTQIDAVWRDVEITFTRNLPDNTLTLSGNINDYKGLVSDTTLLTQIPFVTDIEEEKKMKLEESQANMALYNFGNTGSNTEDGE